MCKLFLAALLSFGLALLSPTLAAQHSAMAPVVVPPVMHAMPMHVAPVSGVHTVPAHSSLRPSSPVRSGSHAASPSVKSAVKPVVRSTTLAPRAAWQPELPPSSLAPIPPFVPNTPVVLPGSIFFGHSCFSGFGCGFFPGNGFGYNNFFGAYPGWGNRFRTTGVIIPFGGDGGFYIPVPYYMPPAPEEEAPANETAAEQPENTGNQQFAAEQPTAPTAAPSFYPPSEPLYEYVFVKRDGTKIFAVAYSLTQDKLQYVTREGLRRSLPLDALDFDATQKSNEERGNTVTLPTPPPSAMAQVL